LNDNVQFCELIFCSSDGDYSLSDAECDVVDMNISIRDDEATLFVVEDPYFSASEVPTQCSGLSLTLSAIQSSTPATKEDAPHGLDSNSACSSIALPTVGEPVPPFRLPVRDDTDQSFNNIPAPSAPSPPGHLSSEQTVPSVDNEPASLGPSEVPRDETVAGNRSDVMKALEKAFTELSSISDLQDLVELHSRMRVVVSVEKLIELKGTHCSTVVKGIVCGEAIHYSAKHIGARVDLEWKCVNGHCGKWESSEVLTTNRYSQGVFE